MAVFLNMANSIHSAWNIQNKKRQDLLRPLRPSTRPTIKYSSPLLLLLTYTFARYDYHSAK